MKRGHYKGGRKAIISPMRVTVEEKNMIDAARCDYTYSDYLVKKATEDLKKLKKHLKTA
jgi:hypothetical protein